jgi:hypothetical protein
MNKMELSALFRARGIDVRFPIVKLYCLEGSEMAESVRYKVTLLTEDELYLVNQGTYFRLYENLSPALLKSEGGRR